VGPHGGGAYDGAGESTSRPRSYPGATPQKPETVPEFTEKTCGLTSAYPSDIIDLRSR
jgi:hypothetical protein